MAGTADAQGTGSLRGDGCRPRRLDRGLDGQPDHAGAAAALRVARQAETGRAREGVTSPRPLSASQRGEPTSEALARWFPLSNWRGGRGAVNTTKDLAYG